MKVKIGPYVNWIGPYQIAEKILFWLDKYEDTRVHKFGTWLAEKKDGSDTTLTKVCNWIHSHQHRQIYVKIDKYDTWSMDSTLSHIVVPMLIQLQLTKHGAPNVADEDVPEGLRSTSAPAKESEYDIDANHFHRWDWVLNEMIYAFTCKRDGTWQEKYSSGTIDFKTQPCAWDEHGEPTMYEMVNGPNDTYVCDYKAMAVEQARITNGFRLFGKYYENLWD